MITENKVTHCPQCSKPVLTAGQFWGSAQFTIKCPRCQTMLTVMVQQQISTRAKMPQPLAQFSDGLDLALAPPNNLRFNHSPPGVFDMQPAQSKKDGFKLACYTCPQGDKTVKKPQLKQTIFRKRSIKAAGLRAPILNYPI